MRNAMQINCISSSVEFHDEGDIDTELTVSACTIRIWIPWPWTSAKISESSVLRMSRPCMSATSQQTVWSQVRRLLISLHRIKRWSNETLKARHPSSRIATPFSNSIIIIIMTAHSDGKTKRNIFFLSIFTWDLSGVSGTILLLVYHTYHFLFTIHIEYCTI